MIKHKFDSETLSEITEIFNQDTARLETEEGVSNHKKFALIELTDAAHYPRVLFHNIDPAEQQEVCEVLEKMLFGETYAELEENSIRTTKAELTNFDTTNAKCDHKSNYDHIEYRKNA